MDKIGYEYENNTSYLTIQAMENQKTGYQIKMLLNNDIPGLLDISMRSMNNQTYYYYDVTFKKPLSKLYEFGKMTWLCVFVKVLIRLQKRWICIFWISAVF